LYQHLDDDDDDNDGILDADDPDDDNDGIADAGTNETFSFSDEKHIFDNNRYVFRGR
jgi:hypothetical protein